MTNWLQKILNDPAQAGRALLEGATGGISNIALPMYQGMAKSKTSEPKSYAEAITSPFTKMDTPAIQKSYKLFNEQRGKYAQENPLLNLSLQGAGALPLAVATGGKTLPSQMGFGAGIGLSQSLTDTASKALGGGRTGYSDIINAGLSTLLGGAASPLAVGAGKAVGYATNKVISPAIKDVYKSVIDNDPGVGILVDNLKKYPKEKIGKIRDFLTKNDAGDYKALTDQMQKDIDKGYREGIRKEVNPRYNKIFYRINKQGAADPYKLPPSQVKAIYGNENYEPIYKSIQSGLENDVRIQMPNGQIAPDNSLAYVHAVRSQAKGLLNKIKKSPDPNLANRLAQENNLRGFIKELDTIVDRSLPVGKKTDLALTDERYSKLITQKDSAMENITSGEITKTNRDRILDYAGNKFEPQLDVMDTINKSYNTGLKSGSANPRDAYREGQLAVDLATGNKMGAIRNVGKIIDRAITGKKPESEIGGYGNFLTSDEGKNLLNKLYDVKNLGDRNEAIKEGISTLGQRSAQSLATQTAPEITPGLMGQRKTLDISSVVKPETFVPSQPIPSAQLFGEDGTESQPLQIPNNSVMPNYQPLSLEDIGL